MSNPAQIPLSEFQGDHLSIKMFLAPAVAGVAIGDPGTGMGVSYLLSSYYSTLAAAQADYPIATALTNEVAWCVIMTAIAYCAPKNLAIHVPSGIYRHDQTILSNGFRMYSIGGTAAFMYTGTGTGVRVQSGGYTLIGFSIRSLLGPYIPAFTDSHGVANHGNPGGALIGLDMFTVSEFTLVDCDIGGSAPLRAFATGVRCIQSGLGAIDNFNAEWCPVGWNNEYGAYGNSALVFRHPHFFACSKAAFLMKDVSNCRVEDAYFEVVKNCYLLDNSVTLGQVLGLTNVLIVGNEGVILNEQAAMVAKYGDGVLIYPDGIKDQRFMRVAGGGADLMAISNVIVQDSFASMKSQATEVYKIAGPFQQFTVFNPTSWFSNDRVNYATSSPVWTLTDLASIDFGVTITSASHAFDASDSGRYINITSGTNWLPGLYLITATGLTGGACTLESASASVASVTAGHGVVGDLIDGALLTPVGGTPSTGQYNFTFGGLYAFAAAEIGIRVIVHSWQRSYACEMAIAGSPVFFFQIKFLNNRFYGCNDKGILTDSASINLLLEDNIAYLKAFDPSSQILDFIGPNGGAMATQTGYWYKTFDNSLKVLTSTMDMDGTGERDFMIRDRTAAPLAQCFRMSKQDNNCLQQSVTKSSGFCNTATLVITPLSGDLFDESMVGPGTIAHLPTYNGGFTYKQGQRVVASGIYYQSRFSNNVGHTPSTNPAWWRSLEWLVGTTYPPGSPVIYGGVEYMAQTYTLGETPGVVLLSWLAITEADFLFINFQAYSIDYYDSITGFLHLTGVPLLANPANPGTQANVPWNIQVLKRGFLTYFGATGNVGIGDPPSGHIPIDDEVSKVQIQGPAKIYGLGITEGDHWVNGQAHMFSGMASDTAQGVYLFRNQAGPADEKVMRLITYGNVTRLEALNDAMDRAVSCFMAQFMDTGNLFLGDYKNQFMAGVPVYSTGTNYVSTNSVIYNRVLYFCTTANGPGTGAGVQNPYTSSGYWIAIDHTPIDDGVNPVQMAGPVKIYGNLLVTGTISGSTAANYVTNLTITATTNVNSPGTPVDGSYWLVRICQDGTGGHQVIWGTGIMLAPTIDASNNSTPNTMCIMQFGAVNGKWYLNSMPILETATV